MHQSLFHCYFYPRNRYYLFLILQIEHCFAYSARNFSKSFFLMSGKFKTQGCLWYGVKGIKSIFADKEKSGTRFVAPVYCLKCCVLISSIKPDSSRIRLCCD